MFKKLLVLILAVNALSAEIPYSLENLLNYNQQSHGFHVNDFEKAMCFGREGTDEVFFSDKHVIVVKDNFKRFCDGLGKGSKEHSIPHIIHLIWLGSNPSETVSACFDSWKKHHPDWVVKIWTDKDIPGFSWSCDHSRISYELADTWAEKADILRLEILYKFGGIYSDADVVCLNSFDELTEQDIGFFSAFELNYVGKHYGEPFFVGSAIMGAKKGSEVMKFCLNNLKSKQDAPEEGIIKRTGPGLISRACQSVLDSKSETVLVLPCSYLYPLPWKKRDTTAVDVLDYVSTDSLAIHLWDGSWCTHKKKNK
ncbi:MAG: glycosyltransferase [Waddliaceae bacterium]